MNYTNDVLDYYHEDLDSIDLSSKNKKELSQIIDDVFESEKEFKDLYSWLIDNGESQEANKFKNLFNYGIDEQLSSEQTSFLKKYDFHIFSKALLAQDQELKDS